RSSPVGHKALLRAQETREPVFSPPMPLLDGPTGFILAVPVFRRGRFEGEVAGTFRGSEFLGSMVLPALNARYEEIILNSGKSLLRGVSAGADFPQDRPTIVTTFGLADVPWEVRI